MHWKTGFCFKYSEIQVVAFGIWTYIYLISSPIFFMLNWHDEQCGLRSLATATGRDWDGQVMSFTVGVLEFSWEYTAVTGDFRCSPGSWEWQQQRGIMNKSCSILVFLEIREYMWGNLKEEVVKCVRNSQRMSNWEKKNIEMLCKM